MPRYILGLSFFYHDAAAVLLKDGEIVAAAQEERFTRKKHDESFPARAIEYVLREAGIEAHELSHIAYYEKPFIHFERLLASFISEWPRGFLAFLRAMPLWIRKKLWVEHLIRSKTGFGGSIVFVDHHLSHAASAFLASPFDSAAILTMDGVGEWATTAYGTGAGSDLTMTHQMVYPDSLGLFYSSITSYLGFKPNSGEYKVMGLAPYGEPAYMGEMRKLLRVAPDGTFALDRGTFGWHLSARRMHRSLAALFGHPPRRIESELAQFHKDVARSAQEVLEEAVLAIARRVRVQTGEKNICLAGGVALNCVANGKLLRSGIFDDVYIQPAAGDAGGALGAALYLEHVVLRHPRTHRMKNVFLGPHFDDAEVEQVLGSRGILYARFDRGQIIEKAADLVRGGGIVGWFQGRMEYGPRSLGNRSILADPREAKNRERINAAIKFREDFRPFAASVLEERASEYFELDRPSPFMLIVANAKRADIPAVVHVDGSCRIQTVDRASNALFYDLLSAFERKTGCPLLINTSFNVRGEPVVCTPEEALDCFLSTGIDYAFIGSYLLEKPKMGERALSPRAAFPLD